MQEHIKHLLEQGEGLKVEFKTASGGIPKNLYETVCAFSNTDGGEILLGVTDAGEIQDIEKTLVTQYKKNFVTTINDGAKINPPLYLSIENIEVDGKQILYINVPQSSQVHRCNARIFVRNEDGDFDITHQQSNVADLYLRKQSTYSEGTIYKGVDLSDLRTDLIIKSRKLAALQQPDHSWASLDDFELLKSAGLYKKDYKSGEEGITMAGVLLFGKDDVISSILPHFKTDLIIRVKDSLRYDDRDDVRTNLIDSYDRIMNFVKKHLPDPFFLNGTNRLNIRDVIFREIASNMLIHREYTNHFPAKLVIEKNRIFTENGNKPYIHGNINPSDSTPYPKNPTIAKFFREIGRAEELGSGVRNITKYAQAYAGSQPILTDKDIFRLDWVVNLFDEDIPPANDRLADHGFTVPVVANDQAGDQAASESDQVSSRSDQASDQAASESDQASDQATSESDQVAGENDWIVDFCAVPRSLTEIMKRTKYTARVYFKKTVLQPLIDRGVIAPVFADKPNHPKQKYIAVGRGKSS